MAPRKLAKQASVDKAFQVYDLEQNGFVTPEEMLTILTRPTGQEVDIDDAKQIIGLFDKNADGKLSLREFRDAWKMFGSYLGEQSKEYVAEQQAYSEAQYAAVVEPHAAAVKSLFERIDADGSGCLSADELREFVIAAQGEEWDEDYFFDWYDAHGGRTVKLREFGWYLADCAACEPSQMGATVEGFGEAVEYVLMRRNNFKTRPRGVLSSIRQSTKKLLGL
jgi:Ca2+-binding EF-hand superfamily protein